MGLTSGFFITLTVIAAVSSLAATVWLWPRVAGRTLRNFGARIGLILSCQVLVIVAFLTFLNGYFTFFGSWSELFGSSTSVTVQANGAAATARPILVTGGDLGPAPSGSSVLPVQADGALAVKPPGVAGSPASPSRSAGSGVTVSNQLRAAAINGEVLQITIRGERTGAVGANDYVYLPPQYFQRAYATARFPVVLALTGYPNEPWSIVKRLALPATAQRLVTAGRIRPAIYLMMNVSVALPRDTECTNVPAGLQVETFFAVDVPQAMAQTFRVETGRAGWAVLGYSTGGYCAAKLAMLNPSQFPAAVSLAGYYYAVKDRTTGNLYGGSVSYQHENDLDWRLNHLPAPPVSVLVTSSRIGERTYPGTMAFLERIHPPMRGYSLILPQGGHNYGTWDRELPQSLEWLSQRLAGPVGQQFQGRPAAAPGQLPRPQVRAVQQQG